MSYIYLQEESNSILSFHPAEDHLENDETSIQEVKHIRVRNILEINSENYV